MLITYVIGIREVCSNIGKVMLPSQRDIVLFLRLSSTLLRGALSLLAKNYFIVKKKAPLFNKETSKF